MPHVNSSGGDDLTSTDEVKVYKDEGEDENRSSENLLEDKHELVTETEEDKRSDSLIGGYGSGVEKRSGGGQDGKTPEPHERPGLPPGGYPLFPPYTYHNGATVPGSLLNHPYLNGASRLHNGTAMFFHSLAQSLASPHSPVSPHSDKGSKVPMVQPPHPSSLSSIMMYPSSEHLAQPPPAHMGIPPVHIDPKTGLPRPPMYAIPPPPGQFSHHLYSDISQMQWNGHPGYSMATGYRGPYPGLSNSPLARFSPPGMLGHPGMHPGMQHPSLITQGPKQELIENHRHPLLHGHDHQSNASDHSQSEVTPKKPHIKKPLNAFMLFMKEQRAKVAAECTLKESAAINQILGRRWHALDRSEQAKYYEMARKEKELHLQLYPGWSARDNYASHTKKKKRKRDPQTPTEAKSPFGQGFARSPPTIGYTETYSGEYVLPNSGSTTMTTNAINNNNHHHTGFDLTSSPRVSQPLQYSIPETQKECTNPKKCRARFGLDQQSQWCKPCRRKKKCIRFMTGEDGSGSDDDDDDDDDDDLEGGGSVATVDSTTDLEGGSSQGSPAPSSSSLHGVGGMRGGTGGRSGLPGNHHPHSGGTGNADHSDNLQHAVVSQSQPGSPPARLPLPLPHPASLAAATSGSGSAATGSGGDASAGDSSTSGSGGSSKKYKMASHQNHSLSDSNQDSLHSTVRVGHHSGTGLSSNNNVDAAVSASNKPHVSTVLAT